jgi:glycosyltransferase involved in cell wall biosynthesis
LLRLVGKKIIYDIHELVAEDIKAKQIFLLKKPISNCYERLEKLACKYFHIILAEKSYEKKYADLTFHSTTIQNFPRMEIFTKWQNTNRKGGDLLYIGNLTGKRGLEQTIKSLAYLKKQKLRIDLLCVGPDDKKAIKILRKLPEYKEVIKQVHFFGLLDIEEAIKISQRCFAGMAILEPVPNHLESWPTKLFEYMALGLPVIISDIPFYKDFIEENKCGISVDPYNIKQIADAMSCILSKTDLASVMANNAIQVVTLNYNWASQEPKLLRFYNEVLNENHYN